MRRPQTGHQTIFVSATISDEIEKLARAVHARAGREAHRARRRRQADVEEVEQYYLSVQPWDKYRLLRTLLEQENPDLAIVFCRTKRGAEKLAKKLHADGIECREIHGNLAQNKRDRVMKGFRDGQVRRADRDRPGQPRHRRRRHQPHHQLRHPRRPRGLRPPRRPHRPHGREGQGVHVRQPDQGDELTKVENLINMVDPAGDVEGFEPHPPPPTGPTRRPASSTGPSTPPPSRFDRPDGAASDALECRFNGRRRPRRSARPVQTPRTTRQQNPRQPPQAPPLTVVTSTRLRLRLPYGCSIDHGRSNHAIVRLHPRSLRRAATSQSRPEDRFRNQRVPLTTRRHQSPLKLQSVLATRHRSRSHGPKLPPASRLTIAALTARRLRAFPQGEAPEIAVRPTSGTNVAPAFA